MELGSENELKSEFGMRKSEMRGRSAEVGMRN